MTKPTTYMLCKRIQNMLTTTIAEIFTYREHWSQDFSYTSILDRYSNEINAIGQVIDPNDLTLKEMTSLGFTRYDESGLMLIPLYLHPFLAKQFDNRCIDGETINAPTNDMDTDNRFGMLAFGVDPKMPDIDTKINDAVGYILDGSNHGESSKSYIVALIKEALKVDGIQF